EDGRVQVDDGLHVADADPVAGVDRDPLERADAAMREHPVDLSEVEGAEDEGVVVAKVERRAGEVDAAELAWRGAGGDRLRGQVGDVARRLDEVAVGSWGRDGSGRARRRGGLGRSGRLDLVEEARD